MLAHLALLLLELELESLHILYEVVCVLTEPNLLQSPYSMHQKNHVVRIFQHGNVINVAFTAFYNRSPQYVLAIFGVTMVFQEPAKN